MSARKSKWRPSALALLLLVAIIALAIPMIMTSLERFRATAGRQPCPSNLQRIGMALLLYARDHGGELPPSLEELIINGTFPPNVLVCPSSDMIAAKGKTPSELQAAYREPGHVSYIYLGANRRDSQLAKDDVVAYELPGSHDDGANVLLGDGRVEFAGDQRLLGLVAATQNRLDGLGGSTQPTLAPSPSP